MLATQYGALLPLDFALIDQFSIPNLINVDRYEALDNENMDRIVIFTS